MSVRRPELTLAATNLIGNLQLHAATVYRAAQCYCMYRLCQWHTGVSTDIMHHDRNKKIRGCHSLAAPATSEIGKSYCWPISAETGYPEQGTLCS